MEGKCLYPEVENLLHCLRKACVTEISLPMGSYSSGGNHPYCHTQGWTLPTRVLEITKAQP